MGRRGRSWSGIWQVWSACGCGAVFALAACSAGGSGSGSKPAGNATVTPPSAGATGPAASSPTVGTPGAAPNTNGRGTAGSGTPSGGAAGTIAGMVPLMGAPGSAGKGAGTAGMAGAASPMMPFTGPLDGDPSKPMVEIPGVKCGVPNLAALQTVKITNRDVVVAYPCAHEGAAVTFFLFLHGTVDEPIKVTFTMNAWPIHNLVDSHNIIVVAPKAIGTQWGNGDNGQDKPHLYDVVDWVYATFGQKFNIRSMWTQGGSWGAFYLSTTFACDTKFQDRLKGIQLIVGGGCPACSNRLSCMVAQQELQLGNGMALSADAREMASSGAMIDTYATMHGCKPKMGPTPVGNAQYWVWPDCQPGWSHSYYLGPGQHADAWDPMVVLKATEELKATEN
jgi:hypothetical protein